MTAFPFLHPRLDPSGRGIFLFYPCCKSVANFQQTAQIRALDLPFNQVVGGSNPPSLTNDKGPGIRKTLVPGFSLRKKMMTNKGF